MSILLRRWITNVAFVALVAFVWREGREGPDLSAEDAGDLRPGVRFVESARDLGLSFEHRPTSLDPRIANVAPQVAAVGAAVSVVDVDVDGDPDLYVVTSEDGGQNALFVNRGDGTFEDRAAEAGLADLNRDGVGCSMGSVWGDFDGDGLDDVFVIMYGRPRLFRNLGDLRFEDVTERAGVGRWVNANAATWFDYDRDGNLDLFVGCYFSEEHDLWNVRSTKIMQDSFEFSRNGGRNFLYRGNGDGTFREVAEEVGVVGTRWTFAAVAADFDRDGWPDLYVANDYGPEELFLNRGGERFELAEGIGLERESKSGMCVALGDVFNEGRLSVFVTNISKRGYLFQGNNLRVNYLDHGAGMVQFADGPTADCGWAWGAQFGDLDNDGRQDLVVVNGFISASQERDYWYQMSKLGIATADVIADASHWPPIEDRSLSGYERTRVLFNDGGQARFVEAGPAVGIDDRYDGRAVALLDGDGDGRLDVVIANQNGPLLYYRNVSDTGHRWVSFALEGAGGNTGALGAEVTVSFAGGTQMQVVTSACGFSSQNERRLHFGLGAAPGPVEARVRWPSGLEQTLADVELDRVHSLREPSP
ncbi:MAG: CRTAC1 family protein [Planctomycetota bacterium JB042]